MAQDTTPSEGGAKEKAANVAGSASDEARGVATDARDQASNVASEVSHQAQSLLGEAKNAVKDQADGQTHRLADTLDGLGSKLQALADGHPDQAGDLTGYLDDMGQRVSGFAQRVDHEGVDGIMDDVQRFARRRPGAFLAGAATAGFLAGRIFRGGTAENGEEPSGQARPREMTSAGTPQATSPRAATAPPTAAPGPPGDAPFQNPPQRGT